MENNEEILKEILKTLKNIEKNADKLNIAIPNNGNFRVCKSWEDCTNPHADCINCPLRYNGGSGSYTTTTSTDIKPQQSKDLWRSFDN